MKVRNEWTTDFKFIPVIWQLPIVLWGSGWSCVTEDQDTFFCGEFKIKSKSKLREVDFIILPNIWMNACLVKCSFSSECSLSKENMDECEFLISITVQFPLGYIKWFFFFFLITLLFFNLPFWMLLVGKLPKTLVCQVLGSSNTINPASPFFFFRLFVR